MIRNLLAALFASLAWSAVVQAQNGPQPPLPVTRLSAGIHVIHAETAATAAQRSIGLMFRDRLAPNSGMVFAFDDPAVPCMWMRNTLIPLSVAFIDGNGVIANIEDMEPRTETTHCATRPVLFALEMTKGWFAQRGIKAGTKISGLARPPAR